MKTLCIIPARYSSMRLPGKPLLDIAGKSLIQRVYEAVLPSKNIDQIIVATDDDQIYQHCSLHKIPVEMTDPNAASGTDRVLELAAKYEDYDIYLNIQGDEPLIDVVWMDELLDQMKNDQETIIYTAACKIKNNIEDPNHVKVVFSNSGRALYFSRSKIPFDRNPSEIDWWQHIGIYAFPKGLIESINNLHPHPIEKTESLEQLRWLFHDLPIRVYPCPKRTIGVDTESDLKEVRAIFQQKASDFD